ncbi:unnamed protein product [Rhizophagus irregularis]|nr:unnamed protein product [Rhizophagus irregularis]
MHEYKNDGDGPVSNMSESSKQNESKGLGLKRVIWTAEYDGIKYKTLPDYDLEMAENYDLKMAEQARKTRTNAEPVKMTETAPLNDPPSPNRSKVAETPTTPVDRIYAKLGNFATYIIHIVISTSEMCMSFTDRRAPAPINTGSQGSSTTTTTTTSSSSAPAPAPAPVNNSNSNVSNWLNSSNNTGDKAWEKDYQEKYHSDK